MANPPTPAQQAAAIVHAQYVPIDYALAQQRASDAKAQAALQAAGHALIAQLQGGIKPAGQSYDAAVNQQQALAQGGAHLLAGLNPNAQIQSNLQQIGAPVEQQQMLQRQTQAQFPGQGGVLNIEQGTIPGASLIAQKAAAQQFLAGLPALAGLSQQRSAQGLAAQAAQNRQALYGQRLQAAAQIPQIAQTIQAAATNRQFQAQQAQAARDFQANQGLLGRQYQANQASLGRTFTANQNRLGRQAAGNTTSGGKKIYGSASTGYFYYDKNGNPVLLKSPTGSGSGGAARSKAFESTRTKVEQTLGLLPSASSASIYGGPATSSNSLGVPKAARGQAYQKIFGIYGPPLLRAGVSPKSVKAMIDTALNQAGYSLPGKKIDARGKRVKVGP